MIIHKANFIFNFNFIEFINFSNITINITQIAKKNFKKVKKKI